MTLQKLTEIPNKSIKVLVLLPSIIAFFYILDGMINLFNGSSEGLIIFGVSAFVIALLSAFIQAVYYTILLFMLRRYMIDNNKIAIIITTFICSATNFTLFTIVALALHFSWFMSITILVLSLPILHIVTAPFVLAYYANHTLKEIDKSQILIPAHHQRQQKKLGFTSGIYGGKESVKLKKSKRKEKPKNDDEDYSDYYLDDETHSKQKRG